MCPAVSRFRGKGETCSDHSASSGAEEPRASSPSRAARLWRAKPLLQRCRAKAAACGAVGARSLYVPDVLLLTQRPPRFHQACVDLYQIVESHADASGK